MNDSDTTIDTRGESVVVTTGELQTVFRCGDDVAAANQIASLHTQIERLQEERDECRRLRHIRCVGWRRTRTTMATGCTPMRRSHLGYIWTHGQFRSVSARGAGVAGNVSYHARSRGSSFRLHETTGGRTMTFAAGVNQETAQRLEEIFGIKGIRRVQINMGYDEVTVVTVEYLVTVEQQEKLVQTLLAVESWVPVATIETNNEEH